MYRVHSIKILAIDRPKADNILTKHIHDIDDIQISARKNSNGVSEATYWIKPYIYEDLEAIKNEFEQAGIWIL